MAKEISGNNKVFNEATSITPEAQGMVGVAEDQKKIGAAAAGINIFGKTYASLYIDDTALKLLVVKGKQVVKWADLRLEPGLVKDGVITAPEVMAQKIKNLLREQNVSSTRLITGFSGLHCLSRVIALPRLSRALLAEAVRHEMERVLPVSLDNVYLAWQIVSSSKEEQKVFVIAYAREIADSLIQTLRQSGIKSYIMDLAPLAISQVVSEKTAAIIDASPTGIDIVIIENGLPEVIRSLPLPQEKSLSDKMSIARDELLRTIKFYFSEKPESSPQVSLPVFASGILMDNPELYRYFFHDFEYPILPVQSTLQFPSNVPKDHYLVNAGLVLKKMSLSSEAGISRVNLNASPQAYVRKAAFPVAPVLLSLGAIIVAAAAFYGIYYIQQASSQIAALRTELTNANRTLTQQLSAQQALNDAIPQLQENVNFSNQTLENLKTVKGTFGTQHDAINGDLKLAVGNLSTNMALVGLTHSGDTITLMGTAPDEYAVRDYAGVLENSGRYSEVLISTIDKIQYTNIVKNGDEYEFEDRIVYDFTLLLKVKE